MYPMSKNFLFLNLRHFLILITNNATKDNTIIIHHYNIKIKIQILVGKLKQFLNKITIYGRLST